LRGAPNAARGHIWKGETMYIYEKQLNQELNKDPNIGVTRWSIASLVQIVASHGPASILVTMSPELATKVGWALLEAAVAKPDNGPEAA